MTWQERLEKLMAKSRYRTVTELAGAANVSAASLGQAIRGKHNPKSSTLDKIAEVLGTTSQYLIYGESQAPGQTVPVLKGEEIGLWFMSHITLDDVEVITAPSEMGDKAFAWRCDVADMQPVFPMGSMVFFEAIQEIINPTNRTYVMASAVLRSMRDAERLERVRTMASNDALSFVHRAFESSNKVIKIESPVFLEYCKTSKGIMLKPVDPQFTAIPLEPMEVIARAKFCLVSLDGD